MSRNLDSSLERFGIDILLYVGKQMVQYVNDNNAEFVKQNHVYITFLEVLERFNRAANRKKRVGLNKKTIQANKDRDARRLALQRGLQIEAVSNDSNKAMAAKVLLDFLSRYRKRLRGHYNLKTERYNILLTLLSNEYFAPKVAEAGVGHLVEDLRKSNSDFAKLRMKTISIQAKLDAQPTASSLIPEYAQALRNLIRIAETMADDPQWSNYVAFLRESVNSAKLSVRLRAVHNARRRKKKNEKDANKDADTDTNSNADTDTNIETNTNSD